LETSSSTSSSTAAVIACAGPFTLHGEPVLAAAAETGTHYLDTTGEQPFMKMVFDRYGATAAGNGAALMTGMGFDYPSASSLAKEGLPPGLLVTRAVPGSPAASPVSVSGSASPETTSSTSLIERSWPIASGVTDSGKTTVSFSGRTGSSGGIWTSPSKGSASGTISVM